MEQLAMQHGGLGVALLAGKCNEPRKVLRESVSKHRYNPIGTNCQFGQQQVVVARKHHKIFGPIAQYVSHLGYVARSFLHGNYVALAVSQFERCVGGHVHARAAWHVVNNNG